jgi:hypothetical protein
MFIALFFVVDLLINFDEGTFTVSGGTFPNIIKP